MNRHASKRCAQPGCRTWPVRGSTFCRWHQTVHDLPQDADAGVTDRFLREQAFAQLLRDGRHDEVIDETVRAAIAAAGQTLSLEEEIGALRLMLRRVIAIDALHGDPRQVAQTMARLVEVTVRTIRMQHVLSGNQSNGFSEAVTQILTEIGLGDEP